MFNSLVSFKKKEKANEYMFLITHFIFFGNNSFFKKNRRKMMKDEDSSLQPSIVNETN